MEWLKGKKTYIVAGLAALSFLIEFLAVGDFSMTAIMNLLQSQSFAALFATVRAGITKSGPIPPAPPAS
ncbi:MAG: hypothetical protein DRJ03_03460 [Chloroflexi bacterium]|nr:MAG: hypothetical protein DRJ03_03460 [Chloroflexota bacterium]